jgi:hypothetical protein
MSKKPNKSRANSERFPVFPSMAAVAGALDLTPQCLRRAKNCGLPGFQAAGRIDSGKLLRGLLQRAADPQTAMEAAQLRLAEGRARRLERENRLREGEIVEIALVKQHLGQRVQSIRLAMDNCPPEALEWRDKVLSPAVNDLLK